MVSPGSSDDHSTDPSSEPRLTRRRLLQGAAAGLALGSSGLLAACGGGGETSSAPPAGSTGGAAPAASTAAAAGPTRGGRLRVGMVGGGASETLDPNLAVSSVDTARTLTIFDLLVSMDPDLTPRMELAESMEPNADASEWTIKLRSGVTWHDGKPFTADDVIYTLRRIGGPKSTSGGVPAIRPVDLDNLKKVDDLTLQVPLKFPIGDLASSLVFYPLVMVQDGATDFSKPAGTGPFMVDTFKPGEGSLFKRNPNYWKEGKPYLDELEMQSIPDAQARYNAVLTGQVDGIEQLSFAQAKEQKSKGEIQVLEGDGPQIVPMLMAADLKPFTDNRVRQAFRLMADRQALLDGAQLGFGQVGNDLQGQGMKWYNDSLPQRAQDVEQAKSLLKAAGAEGLEVTLYSSTLAAGMVESATIFAEQAKQAGVKVTVDNGPADTYYTDKYLKVSFGQTNWPPIPIPLFITESLTKDAFYNETHWHRPDFDKLVQEALGELDEAKAKDKWFEVQKILYDEGGYLIWASTPWLDGLAKNVNGLVPSKFFPWGNWDFGGVWLA